ncbi:hypothetical protein CAPTEDRAFT_198413 [Capitella teleta]|uniref:EGF-like domain-containing protein n=1 Tax=Capitella teleta TaxID=283909 RepID=R7TCT5_CAPTE|nr:hypothetical protein CAPTEDRAFT_198413 [Capitella teleta]|eukprot:ELT91563.1 hypothetical protein CAPTEDRAFT_198413 [Capitella teleta]
MQFSGQADSMKRSLFLVIVLLGVLWPPRGFVQASASCRGSCLHGGRMRIPNNIFNLCHCQCAAGFTGPRCQFPSKKRSAAPEWLPEDVLPPRDDEMNTKDLWKMLRRRLEELEGVVSAENADYSQYSS